MADSRFVDGVIGVQSECLFRGFRRVNRHGLGIKLTLGPTPGFGLEEFFHKNRLGISPRICSIKTKEDSVRVSVRRFSQHQRRFQMGNRQVLPVWKL